MFIRLKRPVPQIEDFILALTAPERGDRNYCLLVANLRDQRHTHCIPIRRFDAIYRFKFRSFCNLCVCGNRVGYYFTNNRTDARNTDDKHQPVGKDGKNEVGDRACGNDGRTLANGFVIESVVAHLWRHRLDAFVEHFDIAAEWNKSDDEFRSLLVKTSP